MVGKTGGLTPQNKVVTIYFVKFVLISGIFFVVDRGSLPRYNTTKVSANTANPRTSSVEFNFRNASTPLSDTRHAVLLVEVMGYKCLVVSTFIFACNAFVQVRVEVP